MWEALSSQTAHETGLVFTIDVANKQISKKKSPQKPTKQPQKAKELFV